METKESLQSLSQKKDEMTSTQKYLHTQIDEVRGQISKRREGECSGPIIIGTDI